MQHASSAHKRDSSIIGFVEACRPLLISEAMASTARLRRSGAIPVIQTLPALPYLTVPRYRHPLGVCLTRIFRFCRSQGAPEVVASTSTEIRHHERLPSQDN